MLYTFKKITKKAEDHYSNTHQIIDINNTLQTTHQHILKKFPTKKELSKIKKIISLKKITKYFQKTQKKMKLYFTTHFFKFNIQNKKNNYRQILIL